SYRYSPARILLPARGCHNGASSTPGKFPRFRTALFPSPFPPAVVNCAEISPPLVRVVAVQIVLIIARVFVLLAALAGAGWAAVLAGTLYLGLRASEDPTSGFEPPPPQVRQDMLRVIPFLAAGGLMGLVGGALAVFGRTGSGGVWMLTAGI